MVIHKLKIQCSDNLRIDAKLMKTSALGCAFTASAVLHTMTHQGLRHGGVHG